MSKYAKLSKAAKAFIDNEAKESNDHLLEDPSTAEEAMRDFFEVSLKLNFGVYKIYTQIVGNNLDKMH